MKQINILVEHTEEFFRRHWPVCTSQAAPVWDYEWEWKGPVPHHSKGGVYALLNETGEILYIGLGASVGRGGRVGYGISRRLLGHVIITDKQKGRGHYKPRKKWSEVAVVAAVGFPSEYAYLAPALEDFLIGIINPPINNSKKRK